MIFQQKGAMFGLDARIALAIFGALSVISGAALYSAIQDSRATALVTDLDNVGKATIAYYLDTGVMPEINTANGLLLVDSLVANPGTPVTGWQGPYTSFDSSGDYWLENTPYGDLSLLAAEDYSWNYKEFDVGPFNFCKKTSSTCLFYVCAKGDAILNSLMRAVENKVDGDSGADNTGKIRYSLDEEGICMEIDIMNPAFGA